MDMEQEDGRKFYDIVKQCKGGLTLVLPAFDSSLPDKLISIDYKTKKVRVPRVFALGIGVNNTLENMYKEGIFTIEPTEEFEQDMQEAFFPIENKKPLHSDEEILDVLSKGNRVKIKEIINSSVNCKNKVIIIARENLGDIPTSMIDHIEKTYGCELRVENENEE